eukprot:403335594
MDSLATIYLQEIWRYVLDTDVLLIGRNQFEQNFVDDLRDIILDLSSQNKRANECIVKMKEVFGDFEMFLSWYEWHKSSEEGIKDPRARRQNPYENNPIHQETEYIFTLNVANSYQKDVPLKLYRNTIIRENFKILDEKDLFFFVQEVKAQNPQQQLPQPLQNALGNLNPAYIFNEKTYLCFGGQLHPKIKQLYNKALINKTLQEIALSTMIEEKDDLGGDNIQSEISFYITFEYDEELKEVRGQVISNNETGINFCHEFIELNLFKLQSRSPDISVKLEDERKWFLYSNNNIVKKQKIDNKDLVIQIDEVYQKMLETLYSQSKWIQVNNKEKLLACQLARLPHIIDLTNQRIQVFKYDVNIDEFIWNPLETFRISDKNDPNLKKINSFTFEEDLKRDSFEFKYVAYKFGKTFNGRMPEYDSIDETVVDVSKNFQKYYVNNQNQDPNLQFGGPFGVQSSFNGQNLDKILSIKKVYNQSNFRIIESEYKRLLIKHPEMLGLQLMKHLFHGTQNTPPLNIYSFENGLDMRHSNPNGANGTGIYFADNAAYSNQYRHHLQNGTFQMFMCLVLTGLSSNVGGGRGIKQPPPIPGRQGELYDSFNNGAGGHYIIYDNQKSYPGYLITYQ